MPQTIIVLSGPIAGGKTRLADSLHQGGCYVVRTSNYIRSLIDSSDRTTMQEFGETLDRETSGKWVVDAIKKMCSTDHDAPFIVIDAVRTLEQIKLIRKRWYKVHHIHLTASSETLKERWIDRIGTVNENATYEEMKQNTTEKDVYTLAAHADFVVDTGYANAAETFRYVANHIGLGTDMRLVDVLIGGQYGSEGKGNVASRIAPGYDVLVRTGGPNAGHKVKEPDGNVFCFHHLPSGTRCNRGAKVVLAPGAVFWVPGLMEEIRACDLTDRRLFIDPQATVIEPEDRDAERGIVAKIGSTGQGVGYAMARRIHRKGANPAVRLAKDVPELLPYIKPTATVLESAFRSGEKVFLEGTQGTGLSLFHGNYPFVTSRDTTVSGCIAECGISPLRVRKVIMVCRTNPIRVADGSEGTSGPMMGELTFEEISNRSGVPMDELVKTETTSTTKRKRRVSEFDWDLLAKATFLNAPTDIALTFVDYISIKNRDAKDFDTLTEETRRFIDQIEKFSGVPVTMVSTKFDPKAILDRRRW